MFNVKAPGPAEPITIRLDDKLRHLISESNGDLGWVIQADREWNEEPLAHVKEFLRSLGYDPKEVSAILGSSITEPWKVVNLPFQQPYPSNRQWNRNAAQFVFEPSKDRDSLVYPTWMRVLNHIGRGLDDAIRANDWAKQNGVLTGADYLKIWISSLFREPREPLPYIFLYSDEQNTGKSLFHEALSMLITRGFARADTALTSQSNFNGELEFAILCIVEETDLRRNSIAYNRIKDWVTSRHLPIHKKTKQPYLVPNTTHWIQCANSHLACVPSNCWIQTEEGPRQVKELINHDCEIVINSKTYATKGFFETGHKETFLISTIEGYSFEATEDHLVQVDFFGLRQWVQVKDLKEDYSICLHNHRNVRWGGNGTYEEGYILGHFIGDGSFEDQYSSRLYTFDDFENVKYIESILSDCNIHEKGCGFVISSPMLLQICRQFGIVNKNLNNHIEEASSDFYEGFLSGLFDTDGSLALKVKRVKLSQNDYGFLQIIQRMLHRLGIMSQIGLSQRSRTFISTNGKEYTNKDNYSLDITTHDNIQIFKERVNFHILRKWNALDLMLKSRKRYNYKDIFTATVKSVIKQKDKKTVFDISVPEVKCFSGNGFVLHNCPVFSGDTRITMVRVEELSATEIIPRRDIEAMLKAEAPDFLAEILATEIPPSGDRLNVPVITTDDKQAAQICNQNPLESFIEEKVHYAPGHTVTMAEFYERFQEWCDPQVVGQWSKIRMGRELPPKYPKGRLGSDHAIFHIGNVSWEKIPEEGWKRRLTVKDNFLVTVIEKLVVVSNGQEQP